MALLSAMAEADLALFCQGQLHRLSKIIEWDSMVDYVDVVDDTLIAYGVSDISEATDIAKLRALARVEVWQAAVAALVPDVDYTDPDGSNSMAQLQNNALVALKQAERRADQMGYRARPAPVLGIVRVTRSGDPFAAPAVRS